MSTPRSPCGHQIGRKHGFIKNLTTWLLCNLGNLGILEFRNQTVRERSNASPCEAGGRQNFEGFC